MFCRFGCSWRLKPSCFLYPDEERCVGSTAAFNALLTSMDEAVYDEAKGSEPGVFAVCRLILRKSVEPRFVALVPQRERVDAVTSAQLQPPGMNVVFLPFADDLRKCDVDGLDEMLRCDPMGGGAEHEALVDAAKKVQNVDDL